MGPCLTDAAPEATPEVPFANEPLRQSPNAYPGDHRGLLSRWGHADLRNSVRQGVRTEGALLAKRMKCPSAKQACQPRLRTVQAR